MVQLVKVQGVVGPGLSFEVKRLQLEEVSYEISILSHIGFHYILPNHVDIYLYVCISVDILISNANKLSIIRLPSILPLASHFPGAYSTTMENFLDWIPKEFLIILQPVSL